MYLSLLLTSILVSYMFQRLLASFCIALSVASISPVYAAPHQTAMLQSTSTDSYRKTSSLGGIKFEMSERQVYKILGKPLKRERLRLEQCGEPAATYIYYTYKNSEVELSEYQGKIGVKSVKTTDRRFRTNKGIRVGDSIKKAQAADPSLQKSGNDGNLISVENFFLMETNKQGKITSISLGYESGC
jgi:hypothetical protein